MAGGAHKSWRDEVAECLAQFPGGASADEVAAHFDHLRTADFFRTCLAALARDGVAVRVLELAVPNGVPGVPARGPRGRVRYRLADERSVETSPDPEGGDAA